jgi:hypothetical protein
MTTGEKMPLITTDPIWGKTAVGQTFVTCMNCRWNGHHYSLLCESRSRRLYCPLCTSTSWVFSKRTVVNE